MAFSIARSMGRTISLPTRGLHHGIHHGEHHGVFHAVGYSMEYTMQDHGICRDFKPFPMVCRMIVGCPIGTPIQSYEE